MDQHSTRLNVSYGGGSRLSVLVALLVTGLIVGCKADEVPADDGVLDDSPPTEVPPTASPIPDAVDDPFAIPDEIDEEYLTLVMQELERIRVEGLRGIYADEELTDENTAFLEAIYVPDQVERVIRQLEEGGVTNSDLRADNLTPEPGVPEVDVTRLLDDQAPDCVFIEVVMDDTVFLREGMEAAEPSYYYYALVPRLNMAGLDAEMNPTPWAIGWAGMDPDRRRVDGAEEHSQCFE